MTSIDPAATALPIAATPARRTTMTNQLNPQAARTAARAAFRDRIERPRDAREAADHDAAIEAFVEQLHRRRVPKGAA